MKCFDTGSLFQAWQACRQRGELRHPKVGTAARLASSGLAGSGPRASPAQPECCCVESGGSRPEWGARRSSSGGGLAWGLAAAPPVPAVPSGGSSWACPGACAASCLRVGLWCGCQFSCGCGSLGLCARMCRSKAKTLKPFFLLFSAKF